MITRRKHVAGYPNKLKFPQVQAGFLAHLTPRRLLHRFTRFNPAPGQLPCKPVLYGLAFTKQYLLSMGYDYRYAAGHHLVVGTYSIPLVISLGI